MEASSLSKYIIDLGVNERIVQARCSEDRHALTIRYSKGWDAQDTQEHTIQLSVSAARRFTTMATVNDGSGLSFTVARGEAPQGPARVTTVTLYALQETPDLDQFDVQEAVRVARECQFYNGGAACGSWIV